MTKIIRFSVMLFAAAIIFASCKETQVPVTGITLNYEELELYVGEYKTLIPIVTPTNANNRDVTWISSETDVASVVNGLVTALTAGATTITATTVDGGKTATAEVIVSEEEEEEEEGDDDDDDDDDEEEGDDDE